VTEATHAPADLETALSRTVADHVEGRVGSAPAMPEQSTATTCGGAFRVIELGGDGERDCTDDAVQAANAGDDASEVGGPGRHEGAYSERYDHNGRPSGDATMDARGDATTGELQRERGSLAAAGLDNSQVVGLAHRGSGVDHDLLPQPVAPTVGPDSGGNSDATGMDSSCIITTRVGEETAVNPLVNAVDPGRGISHINGLPITMASPVDVGFGWVQLREDGWLTVTPDVGYRGRISFHYSATGTAGGQDMQGHVLVDVGADAAPAAVALRNKITAVAEDVSTASALKVADVAMTDCELGTDGLSLTGLDASMFEIVDSALYLKQGIDLDFDAKPTLSVEILAPHADGPDEGASFTLDVAGAGASALAVATDMFVFAPSCVDMTGAHPLIDLSSIRNAVFQELMDAGALIQEGDNVVITLSPDDSADLHRIILKGDAVPLGDTDL
jgi:hypothetical protein